MDADELEEKNKFKWVKVLVSNVGLLGAVVIYVVGGAFLFIEIEGPDNEASLQSAYNRAKEIEKERDELATTLWAHKWSPEYAVTVEKLINEYHQNMSDAIEKYGYDGEVITDEELEDKYAWKFASAILFTVTVVTTIGYGHIAPATEMGQLVLIAYAIIGIPLMLMFMATIGDAMAKFFRRAYGKGCCRCCHQRRIKEHTYMNSQSQVPDSKAATPRSEYNKDLKRDDLEGSDEDDEGIGTARSRHSRRKADDYDQNELQGGPDTIIRDGEIVDNKQVVAVKEDELDIDEDAISVPITLTLTLIAAYIMVGGLLYSVWEDWTFISATYFCFISLSTIGFGDMTPGWADVGTSKGNIKLLLSSAYIVLGLAVLSMSFNLMMEEMIEKFRWFARKIGITDDEEPAPVKPTENVDNMGNVVDDAMDDIQPEAVVTNA